MNNCIDVVKLRFASPPINPPSRQNTDSMPGNSGPLPPGQQQVVDLDGGGNSGRTAMPVETPVSNRPNPPPPTPSAGVHVHSY